MLTHEEGVYLGGQPRHCVCTMRHAVCQRQLSFLFSYAVKVNRVTVLRFFIYNYS